jgi:hypothetical protein
MLPYELPRYLCFSEELRCVQVVKAVTTGVYILRSRKVEWTDLLDHGAASAGQVVNGRIDTGPRRRLYYWRTPKS